MEVWKYSLDDPEGSLNMPTGAKLLTAQVQHGDVVVWALVDSSARKVMRRIVAIPTGGGVPASGAYVATVQLLAGGLVFHVFDFGELPS